MKKLTKIIGTLFVIGCLTGCDIGYKEITLEEAQEKEVEIANRELKADDKKLAIVTDEKASCKYDGYIDINQDLKLFSYYHEEKGYHYEDLNKNLIYRKVVNTTKQDFEGKSDDVNKTETREEWDFYKDGKYYSAYRLTVSKNGTSEVQATYSEEKMDNERFYNTLSLYFRLNKKNISVTSTEFIRDSLNLLNFAAAYDINSGEMSTKLYSNGGATNVKYVSNYDATITYKDIDIAKLTRDEVQNQISQHTTAKFTLNMNAYNDWNFSGKINNLVTTKNNKEYIKGSFESTTSVKGSHNVDYPNLKDFKKVAF